MSRTMGASLSAVVVAAACSEAGPTVGIERAGEGATGRTRAAVDLGVVADVAAVPVRDAEVDAGAIPVDGSPRLPPARTCAELDCPPRHGMPQVCVESPSGDGEGPRCVADPRGRAYLARDFRLVGLLADRPEAGTLVAAFERLFNESGYTLSLVFPPADANRQFSPLRFRAHLVQGAQPDEAGALRGVPEGTSSSAALVEMVLAEESADEEFGPVWGIWPLDPTEMGCCFRTHSGFLELMVPLNQSAQVCFQHTTTASSVVAALVPAEGGHELVARLRTCLGSANADFDLDIAGAEGQTLRAVLDDLAEPACDSNGDAQADGWAIDLHVRMRAVTFAGEPDLFEGAPFSPLCD